MKKLALHWKILIGMAIGVAFGIILSFIEGGDAFIRNYIKPFGTIFINLLKLIAVHNPYCSYNWTDFSKYYTARKIH
jgi:Na+/H+-dicarboxylate symporter